VSRLSTQTIGLAAAGGVALALAVVVAVFYVQSPRPAPTARDADEPEAPALVPGGMRDDASPAAAGRAGVLQFMDRNDPERLQSELVYDTIEPTGVQRYAVGQPRAWIYQRDGSAVHVAAERGDFVMVGQQERRPEAGTLSGGVLIRAFDAETVRTSADRLDPDMLAPALTARVQQLEFDFTVNEIATEDRLEVDSPDIRFVGTGVRAIYSETRERLERLDIQRDGRVIYTPPPPVPQATPSRAAATPTPAPTTDAGAPRPSPSAAAAAPTTGTTTDSPRATPTPAPAATPTPTPTPPATAPPTQLLERFYAVDITGSVRIEQDQRRIDGDRLLLWGRLVNNRFVDDAFGPTAFVPPASPSAGVMPMLSMLPMLAALTPAAQAENQPEAVSNTRASPDFTGEVVATWSGPLVLRALDARPPELARDEAALRMTASPSALRFRDRSIGVEGYCDELHYAATRRELVLLAAAPQGVDVRADEAGRLLAQRFEAGLTTGLARVPGAGALRELGPSPEGGSLSRAEILWTDGADFAFETGDRGATGVLQRAEFAGDVRATDGLARLEGGFVRAEFERSPAASSALRRLVVREHAMGEDGRGGVLLAQELDVAFEDPRDPGSREPFDPTILLARGRVEVQREGESLRCELLEADLGREPESGRVAIQRVFAEGAVRLTGEDGLRAGSERLIARVPEQQAELIGDDAFVELRAACLEGGAIQLDGLARTVEIIGAGRFRRGATAQDPSTIDASWLGRMFYDDGAGLLEASGRVSARGETPGVSRETVRGDRVRVRLTPGEPADASPLDATTGARSLRSFLASSETDGERASVETRRFADGAATRIVYIEGAIIEADGTERLEVPGPGRMFVRELPPGSGEGTGSIARGDALFDWAGRMTYDRAHDTFELRRNVRLTHRRDADGEITDLECERLTGRLVDDPDAPSADASESAGPGRLREAAAEGAVYLRSGGREVVADELIYDADRGVARARAAAGNRLTMFDGNAGTAVTAEGIEWDLVTGRIDLRRPGRLTAPR